jgi:hypothetical protein
MWGLEFAMVVIEPNTVYLDDSGTNPESRVVVAAFCVSTLGKWRKFDAAWRAASIEYGFDHFHMTEFMGCRKNAWCRDCRKGKTTEADHPWRGWSNTKRNKTLRELVRIICKYTEYGKAIALSKEEVQKYIINSPLRPTDRGIVGQEEFTFAVQVCGGELAIYRKKQAAFPPLKFVFDICPQYQKDEIAKVFLRPNRGSPQIVDGIEQWFEVETNGVSYESRKHTFPLLAADMLAWVTAKLRAHMLFGKSWGKPHYYVAKRFLDSGKLHIGYSTEHDLIGWNERIAKFLTGNSEDIDEEEEVGSD